MGWSDGGREAGDRDDAGDAASVVVGVDVETMSPSLGGVVHHAQAASAAQPRHVRHAELRGDVAAVDEDLDIGRRVAAERDASKHAGDRFHERQRTISEVADASRMNAVRLAMIHFGAVVVDQNDVAHSSCSAHNIIRK